MLIPKKGCFYSDFSARALHSQSALITFCTGPAAASFLYTSSGQVLLVAYMDCCHAPVSDVPGSALGNLAPSAGAVPTRVGSVDVG